MELFEFGNPHYLKLLYALPLVVLLFWASRYWRVQALKRYGDPSVVRGLMPGVSRSRPVLKFILFLLAMALVIVALARPRFGKSLKTVEKEGISLLVALDVSNSMLAEDIKPNRLERAKRAIAKLTDRFTSDKIGLIIFAGDAYMQVPVTTDYSALKMFLSSVSPQQITNQGTAIGSAIDLAMNSFPPNAEGARALVVLTDGENHQDNPVDKAREAAQEGIHVYTMGVGLSKAVPIPNPERPGTYFKDTNGQTAVTKLDEATLQKIALAGNGSYVRANNLRTGLNAIYDEMKNLERGKTEITEYDDYAEKFQYYAGIAVLLLVAEFFLKSRKNRWLSEMKWFEGKNA